MLCGAMGMQAVKAAASSPVQSRSQQQLTSQDEGVRSQVQKGPGWNRVWLYDGGDSDELSGFKVVLIGLEVVEEDGDGEDCELVDVDVDVISVWFSGSIETGASAASVTASSVGVIPVTAISGMRSSSSLSAPQLTRRAMINTVQIFILLSALHAKLVKVPDNDSDAEMDLPSCPRGQPVPVRTGHQQIGVPQLVSAAEIVRGEGVPEVSCRPPGDDVQAVEAGGGGDVAEAVAHEVVSNKGKIILRFG